jgi:hypothetical protein
MEPVGIGVIGIGRGWGRWQRALLASADVAVVAVHDPVPLRAAAVGERLRASATGGVVELLGRDDVEAVLLGPAWFGNWPLAHAAARNKPVLCAAPLEDDVPGAVWPAAWPALWSGGRVLREVVAGLGAVRFVQAIAEREGEELLTLAADLFGAEPVASRGVRADGASSWLVEFGAGRVGQVTLRPGSGGTVSVEAEGGWARLELPDRLEWGDASGRHSRVLMRAAEFEVLRAFAAAVRAGEPMDDRVYRLRRAGALLSP